mgnify:CR=1 FL=1
MSEQSRIGPADAFGELPAEVDLDGTPYWLVRKEDGSYSLLMALCPHAGGEVRPANGLFFCPLHFWTFDGQDGACLNMDGERLMRRDVAVRDGILYAVGAPY